MVLICKGTLVPKLNIIVSAPKTICMLGVLKSDHQIKSVIPILYICIQFLFKLKAFTASVAALKGQSQRGGGGVKPTCVTVSKPNINLSLTYN